MTWKNSDWLTLFCHWFGGTKKWEEMMKKFQNHCQRVRWALGKWWEPCSPAIAWLWSLSGGGVSLSLQNLLISQEIQWPFTLRSNWMFFFSFLQILVQSSWLLLVLSTCFSYHFSLEIKSVPWYGILLTLLILPWPPKFIFGINWFQEIIS